MGSSSGLLALTFLAVKRQLVSKETLRMKQGFYQREKDF
jgi:hypothetical protein